MTGATHILVAAATYKLMPSNKPLALTLAFTSHFVFDAIPHYEITKKENYILGLNGGFIVLIAAIFDKDIFLLFAAFLGAFPDLNTLFFKNKLLMNIHNIIHSGYKIYRPWISISFELILSIVCILLLIYY